MSTSVIDPNSKIVAMQPYCIQMFVFSPTFEAEYLTRPSDVNTWIIGKSSLTLRESLLFQVEVIYYLHRFFELGPRPLPGNSLVRSIGSVLYFNCCSAAVARAEAHHDATNA